MAKIGQNGTTVLKLGEEVASITASHIRRCFGGFVNDVSGDNPILTEYSASSWYVETNKESSRSMTPAVTTERDPKGDYFDEGENVATKNEEIIKNWSPYVEPDILIGNDTEYLGNLLDRNDFVETNVESLKTKLGSDEGYKEDKWWRPSGINVKTKYKVKLKDA